LLSKVNWRKARVSETHMPAYKYLHYTTVPNDHLGESVNE